MPSPSEKQTKESAEMTIKYFVGGVYIWKIVMSVRMYEILYQHSHEYARR
jgi:hypothetical protein